jgi:hypothetical protein
MSLYSLYVPVVVITVPHYTCLSNKFHDCDKKAEALADMIYEKLSEVNIDTKVFLGGINRTKIDLNRFESRHTNFRKRIREYIEKAKGKVILLDCHSFDKTHTFFEKYKDPDFVILSDNLKKFGPYVFKLRDMLEEAQIKTNVLSGIQNDIIDEFEANSKVTSVLLEVSEVISDKKLNIISDTIKNWILDLIQM